MFKCDSCGENSAPGEKQHIVMTPRAKTYRVTRIIRKKEKTFVYHGFEPESELKICKYCAGEK